MFGSAAFVDVTSRHLDEGQMATVGGSVAVSLTSALRTEVGLETGLIDHGVSSHPPYPDSPDQFRQTLLTVSLLVEAPSSRKYRLVAGGGFAGVFQRWTAQFRDIRPGLCCETLPARYATGAIHGRIGLAVEPHDRLVIRMEGVVWRAIESTTVGVRGSLGWRF